MEQINHRGKVIAVAANNVTAVITGYSACHNCDARHGCGLMECKTKTVDIATPHAASFNIGEEVNIGIAPTAGMTAVFYGYVLPLLLMLAVLISCTIAGISELISGISAIIILIPYYLGLFLRRKQFKQKFNFTISKI